MHSYVISGFGIANPPPRIERDDGWCLPLVMTNAMTRRFIWEWINGATAVDEFAVPIPYTAPDLASLSLDPVTDEPPNN